MVQFSLDLTDTQVDRYQRDGFLIVDRIIDDETVEILRQRMDALFAGHYASGLVPDEVNYRPNQPDQMATRQLCNAWKADPRVAEVLLSPAIGKAIARLGGWPGARIAQDNILFKPPGGGKPLGLHQDSAYATWSDPADWHSCWIALDDTTAEGGTMELVPGSHRWGRYGVIEQFHAPEDYKKDFRKAADAAGVTDPEFVPVVVKAGGGSFHSGWTWHGSGPNRTDHVRRTMVAHCMSSEARFTRDCGYVYSRYKRMGTDEMDEGFFPVLWREDGYRSPYLDRYAAGDLAWSGAA